MKKEILLITMLLLTGVFIISGCNVDRKQKEKEKQATTDTINMLMAKMTSFADHLNADSLLYYLSDDTSAMFITAGMCYPKNDFGSVVKKLYRELKEQNMQVIHSNVIVPTSGTGIWTGSMKSKFITGNDKTGAIFLCETWVWQRGTSGWKAIHFHESVLHLPGAEERSLVENALGLLAKEISGKIVSPGDMPEILTSFLQKYPPVYGATLAFAPTMTDEKKHVAAPYIYRSGSDFKQVDLPEAYDYTISEWYKEPVSRKSPWWSNPYYDNGGGGIVMVTYSIPLYTKEGNLTGVLTSDLELRQK